MAEKFWTEERCQICRARWAEGVSAAAIAVEIGAVSRNSVLSKVHRSGWPGLNSSSGPDSLKGTKPRAGQRRRSGFKFPRKVAADGMPGVAPAVMLPPGSTASAMSFSDHGPDFRKRLLDLGAVECRWPIGDPHHPDFGFCSAPRQNDHDPYCRAHNRVARP